MKDSNQNIFDIPADLSTPQDFFSFMKSKRAEKVGKQRFTFNGADDYYIEQDKLFEDYLFLHNIADVFTYLLKVNYASSSENVRRKNYRLEIIFQNYITKNNITLNKIKKIISPNQNKEFLKEFCLEGGITN